MNNIKEFVINYHNKHNIMFLIEENSAKNIIKKEYVKSGTGKIERSAKRRAIKSSLNMSFDRPDMKKLDTYENIKSKLVGLLEALKHDMNIMTISDFVNLMSVIANKNGEFKDINDKQEILLDQSFDLKFIQITLEAIETLEHNVPPLSDGALYSCSASLTESSLIFFNKDDFAKIKLLSSNIDLDLIFGNFDKNSTVKTVSKKTPTSEIKVKEEVVFEEQCWEEMLEGINENEVSSFLNPNPNAEDILLTKVITQGSGIEQKQRSSGARKVATETSEEEVKPVKLAEFALRVSPEIWKIVSPWFPKSRKKYEDTPNWDTTYTDLSVEGDSSQDIYNAVSGNRVARIFNTIDDANNFNNPQAYFIPIKWEKEFEEAEVLFKKFSSFCKGHL